MKSLPRLAFFLFPALAFACGLLAALALMSRAAQAGVIKSPNLQPAYGWYVCADLGVGPVPGLGENRQRFSLCHGDGWEILAYCLDPGMPMPEYGTTCEEIPGEVWFCGEAVQRLQLYDVVATPTPPTPTRTPTATPTITPSPTPTITPTPPGGTGGGGGGAGGGGEELPPRVQPGGEGNLRWAAVFSLSALGLALLNGIVLLYFIRMKRR